MTYFAEKNLYPLIVSVPVSQLLSSIFLDVLVVINLDIQIHMLDKSIDLWSVMCLILDIF